MDITKRYKVVDFEEAIDGPWAVTVWDALERRFLSMEIRHTKVLRVPNTRRPKREVAPDPRQVAIGDHPPVADTADDVPPLDPNAFNGDDD